MSDQNAAGIGLSLVNFHTVTADDQRRISTASFRFLLLGTRRLLVPLLIVVALLLALVISRRSEPWVGLGVAIFFIIFVCVFLSLSIRWGIRSLYPIGSIIGTGFGANSFIMRTPTSTSEIQYSAFKSVRMRRDIVFLSLARGSNFVALPLEVVPPADLDRLRQHFAGR